MKRSPPTGNGLEARSHARLPRRFARSRTRCYASTRPADSTPTCIDRRLQLIRTHHDRDDTPMIRSHVLAVQ